MIKQYFLIFLLICIIGVAGCTIFAPKLKEVPPPDINDILATLQVRYDLVDSMKTWMIVKVESDGQEGEIGAQLYYQKPNKLRVDAMGVFSEPKAVILAVEKLFRIYFVPENEVMTGDLSDEVIRDIFDIDLRVSDVRSSIFANPFLDGNTDQLKIEVYGDEWLIRRPSTLAGCHEEISILTRNTAVSKWQVKDEKGEVIQEVSFSKYQKVGEILRPLKAVIHRPIDGTRIFIESVDPAVNMELDELTFDLPIPKTAKVTNLSESE